MSPNTNTLSNVVIVALITTFNRQECLVRCLNSLDNAATYSKIRVQVVLANSGTEFHHMDLGMYQNLSLRSIQLDPTFYWASSMRKAWEYAQIELEFTHLMWLNDDVELFPNAFEILFRADSNLGTEKGPISGAVQSSDKVPTYGGKKSFSKIRPLRLLDIKPNGSFQFCDTFNGNVVLISRQVDEICGGFPKSYRHNRADIAYGFTARNLGLTPLVAPDFVGICEDNDHRGDFMDRSMSKTERLKLLLSPKGIPIKEWFIFCFRYGGALAPIYFIGPYLKFFIKKIY